jgi:predicted DsbA family dithiol-disulfide isomerase
MRVLQIAQGTGLDKETLKEILKATLSFLNG